jgi:hypothetical protein
MLVSQLLVAFAMQAAPQTAPAVTIPRLEAKVVIDGDLNEEVWAQAAVLSGFHQYEPVDGRPAEERTEVLVWYAPDAIHFGIRAYDSQPGRIRATQADRDNIGNEDQVILYLDTFNDQRRAFYFAVNPLGVQSDGVRTEGAGSAGRTFGGNIDNSPDFTFESRGRVNSDGYTVEVLIPFKSLRYPSANVQRWSLQVERKTQRTGYTDTWTDVRRANASFLLQSGTIEGLHDLERGVVLEAQPFVTVNTPGTLDLTSNEFARSDPDFDTGINLRVGFTNISLDATINPDFSQVESDAGQVTVNERFALFFPEKRPFFLEGIELFNTPGQLVYTRRIANPIVGAKVTGKLGPLNIAHLTAVDEDVPEVRRQALFNITRVRQDFGANSSAGLTFTDRSDYNDPAYNRVLSGDVRYVFGGMYFLQTQYASAWTSADEFRDARRGELWNVELDRTGRRFGFNYSINGVDDDFHTSAGFVNRTGIINAHAFNRLSFYGAQGALLEQLRLIANPSALWNYDEFGNSDAVEGAAGLSANARLRGGWVLEAEVNQNFFNTNPADYSGLEISTPNGLRPYLPLERITGGDFGVSVETPTFRRFDASFEIGTGTGPIFEEGSEGRGIEAGVSLTLRPTAQIRVSATTAYARIVRTRDDSEFARSVIPRIKAEYQASRHLFFRGIVEHRSERVADLVDARTGEPLLFNGVPFRGGSDTGLRFDALASYEPTPGTVAYIGYGSSYAELPGLGSRVRRVSDGFFVKLAYQFRR